MDLRKALPLCLKKIMYTETMSVVVKLDKLTKFYGRSNKPAIKDVSLSIKSGEVYGFIGSNGAGKSTTIRTIMGFLRQSSGVAEVLGKDSIKDSVEIRSSIGYLSGDVILPKRVTGRKLINYLAKLGGGVDQTYLAELVDRFEAQMEKKTDALSKGNRQKIGLIQAFMHQPKVLILDEPTSGLDPLMQEKFYLTIEEAKNNGAAVFLSSHNFSEVERICDRVGIIRDGRLVHEGPVSKMMELRLPTWRIVLDKKSDISTLKKQPELEIISVNDTTVSVRPVKEISPALAAISKVKVISMTVEQDELEDEFMSFYEDQEVSA